MDGPDHEPDTKIRTFQDPLYPSIEDQDLFSIHVAQQAAEEWPPAEFTMPQSTLPQGVNESIHPLHGVPSQVNPPGAQIAHQVAGTLSQYSMLWETYNTKKAQSERLEKENEELRVANFTLVEEQELLERRHVDQEALIAYYGQIFDQVRHGIVGLIKDWEGSSTETTSEEVETIDENGTWDP
ncbi:uncharacterized protein N7498_001670 [Penicillium cinerascens]|uniref:Uncharacterized protein n=1 Tax=Penicillium cinerascens TaxID=70096 RepID=A0A9W9N8K4_9EURO|nr:uncharacterized protein N7498_001670 [Penicillium cinerascens]KAJ5215263.1 hypothetical protein N7498_001670 [Penicillium cinerascens]